MNPHLNLFRFFNQIDDEKQHKKKDLTAKATNTVKDVYLIENNLSRAFALCLVNNNQLLYQFASKVVSESDFEYIFNIMDEDTELIIDLQINTGKIPTEDFRRVYPVAITSNNNLEIENFFNHTVKDSPVNVTDIVLYIKDIAIIIEVKITNENCSEQLYNQIAPFIQNEIEVRPAIHFSWQKIVRLMEQIYNSNRMSDTNSVFIQDFLDLVRMKYSHWFEPKPFYQLTFSSQKNSSQYSELSKRLRQILSLDYEILPYSNRLGIVVEYGWASEIVVDFQLCEQNNCECVSFYLWPGNTKQQGSMLYNRPLTWIEQVSLDIKGNNYPLKIMRNVKFSHFNKYISGFNYGINDLKNPHDHLHSAENYWYSGKKNRADWSEFEEFMDRYFLNDFNWRMKCSWGDKFIESQRKYFVVSFGFEVKADIPYHLFQEMDKSDNDIQKVSDFIDLVEIALRRAIHPDI